MPEDHWARLNTNHFRDVWTPFAHRANGGNQKPDAVVGAWSSMAWDSARGDLIFWGGGHANYPGNEIYLWHSSTLEWERASLPSEVRSEEHTSELQSLMRISYAVFCLKKKK